MMRKVTSQTAARSGAGNSPELPTLERLGFAALRLIAHYPGRADPGFDTLARDLLGSDERLARRHYLSGYAPMASEDEQDQSEEGSFLTPQGQRRNLIHELIGLKGKTLYTDPGAWRSLAEEIGRVLARDLDRYQVRKPAQDQTPARSRGGVRPNPRPKPYAIEKPKEVPGVRLGGVSRYRGEVRNGVYRKVLVKGRIEYNPKPNQVHGIEPPDRSPVPAPGLHPEHTLRATPRMSNCWGIGDWSLSKARGHKPLHSVIRVHEQIVNMEIARCERPDPKGRVPTFAFRNVKEKGK